MEMLYKKCIVIDANFNSDTYTHEELKELVKISKISIKLSDTDVIKFVWESVNTLFDDWYDIDEFYKVAIDEHGTCKYLTDYGNVEYGWNLNDDTLVYGTVKYIPLTETVEINKNKGNDQSLDVKEINMNNNNVLGEMGRINDGKLAISFKGEIAVKRENGDYVSCIKGIIENQSNMIMLGMDKMLMVIPSNEVAINDILKRNGEYYCVKAIYDNGNMECIDFETGTSVIIVKEVNLMGVNYYSKVINMFKLSNTNNSSDIPLSMLMMNGDSNSNLPLMMAMMNGDSNLPLMMAMMNKSNSDSGDIDGLMKSMMMAMMMNGGK